MVRCTKKKWYAYGMNNTILHNTAQKITRLLYLQCFLNLFSLPFLIAWGIPCSLLSPLANIIFAPFLDLFLILSSFIFLTELCSLPNSFLITLLEQLTFLWRLLLSQGSKKWLIAFIKPGIMWLFLMHFITLYLLLYKKIPIPIKIGCCSTLFGIITILLHFSYPGYQKITLPSLGTSMTFLATTRGTILIDHGALSHSKTTPSFVEYTLIPELIKTTGTLKINVLFIPSPSAKTIAALSKLIEKMDIKLLVFPFIKRPFSRHTKHAFYTLRKTVLEHHIILIRAPNKK